VRAVVKSSEAAQGNVHAGVNRVCRRSWEVKRERMGVWVPDETRRQLVSEATPKRSGQRASLGLSLLPDDLDTCRLRLTRMEGQLEKCRCLLGAESHAGTRRPGKVRLEFALHWKALVAARRADGAETRMPGTWYAVMGAADWAEGVRGGRGQKEVGVARAPLCHSLGHCAGPA
jgi:hypothetical protein